MPLRHSDGHRESIAIVGLAFRFPGKIVDLASYWNALINGIDAVQTVPPTRWNTARYTSPYASKGKIRSDQAGLLTGVDLFDHQFFRISPREARVLDPQQRLLLELAWEALEDAGLPAAKLAGQDTGVFLGVAGHDYADLQDFRTSIGQSSTGQANSIVANRISNFLDLRGPSLTVDTACSSGLVALHLACQSLRAGESSLALVGASNLLLDSKTSFVFSQMGMLSPRGRCRAFAADADGYVRSEGVAVLVLKPLAQALSDRDRVHATVLASAINQDGQTSSLTVPNPDSQLALLTEVYGQDLLGRGEVAYVEAHGTGTPVGDPIEAEAIGKVLGARFGQLPIGSVKTNIGHLETASGLAGLLKAILVLQNREVPPNLHFEEPNPAIPFEDLGIFVPTRSVPLTQNSPLVGVNSFGFGGTNCHVVLGQAPPLEPLEREPLSPIVHLPLSARHPESLQELIKRCLQALAREDIDLHRFGSALAHRRDHHLYREMVIGRDREELGAELEALLLKGPNRRPTSALKLAFVFCGQGSEWWSMGQELLRTEPVFRATLERCDRVFRKEGDWSIIEELNRPEAESRLAETEITQVTIFTIQVGLVELLRSWGVEAEGVVGHSVGEIAAAFTAGIMSLEEACFVSFYRGLSMRQTPGRGAMLAVAVEEKFLPSLLGDLPISVAAVNHPGLFTLSAEAPVLEKLEERLSQTDLFYKRLSVEYAFHSPMMDPARALLETKLEGLKPRPARLPVASTVTGSWSQGSEWTADYHWRNVRQTVRFADALDCLMNDGFNTFLEIGPHPVLQSSIRAVAQARGQDIRVLSTLRKKQPEQRCFHLCLSDLYQAGHPLSWSKSGPVSHYPYPAYPWNKSPHWVDSRTSRRDRFAPLSHPLLGVPEGNSLPSWRVDLQLSELPYLAHHRLGGEPLFPAAGYVEMALAAAASVNEHDVLSVQELEFPRAWFLKEQDVAEARFSFQTNTGGRFSLESLEGDEWLERCRGRVSGGVWKTPRQPDKIPDPDDWQGPEELYQAIGLGAIDYGPTFRTPQRWWLDNDILQADLEFDESSEYLLHPCLLDGCLQLAGLLLGEKSAVLPVSLARIRLYQRGCSQFRVEIRRSGPRKTDLRLFSLDGEVVAELEGLVFAPLDSRSSGPSLLYQVEWLEREPEEGENCSGPWLVVGQGKGPENLRRLLDSHLCTQPEAASSVVYFANQQLSPSELAVGFADFLQQQRPGVRLWVVTEGCQALPGCSLTSPAAALLWGMARVARRELPENRPTLVELAGAEPEEELSSLLREMKADPSYSEAGFHGTRCFRPSLTRISSEALWIASARVEEPPTPMVLRQSRPGHLESLNLVAFSGPNPGESEVEVEVCYAGLNFSDVLKAINLYPGTPGGPLPMGLEFSGRVTRTGKRVTRFQPGDLVMGLAAEETAFSSRLCLSQNLLVPLPPGLGLQEAATLPVAYLTVLHALQSIGRLGKGQSLLVHSASGGVGLAAIALAKRLGAKIFATAGREDKRAFLRELELDWVGDSRSLDFADQIREHQGHNRGVDMVLSALVGEAKRVSLELLEPGGHFIEIGKKDHYDRSALELSPFRHNLSYSGVDLEQTLRRGGTGIRTYLEQIVAGFEEGWVSIPRHQSFLAQDAEQAFRLMAGARHLGKVLLDFQGAQKCLPAPPIKPGRTYLVSGGLGGVGLEVAHWLASVGADHLLLLSRTGKPLDGDLARLKKLQAKAGLNVLCVAGDVSDRGDLQEALSQAEAPLAGVFHLAMQLDDANLQDITADKMERVLRPKAAGAWVLHQVTQQRELDCFVLFGSVAAKLGSPGQLNYAAANAYLTGLAHYRRQLGLPACVIHWGPLGGAGHLTRDTRVKDYLERLGLTSLTNSDVREVLDLAVKAQPTELVAARVNWSQLTGFGDSTLLTELQAREGSQRKDTGDLLSALRARAADALGTEVEKVPLDRPLSQLGLDSLMAFELRNWLQDRRGLQVSPALLLKGPTLLEIVGELEQTSRQNSATTQDDLTKRDPLSEKSGQNGRSEGPTATTPQSATASKPDSPIGKPSVRPFSLRQRPALLRHRQTRHLAQLMGLKDPFFVAHQGVAGATSLIDQQELINFASYNYLGLSGHPEVTRFAAEALERYGTSVSASRLVAGQRPLHQELEQELADFLGTEQTLTLVSGHATNVTLIPQLIDEAGLILHDSLIHDCVLQGARASRATRRSFAHNDLDDLERLLALMRPTYQETVVAVEGLYSMDGDYPDLPRLMRLKREYGFLLLIDEAHSVGVLGKTGRGLAEVFELESEGDVLWMGTLSKSLASCGGYIAGDAQVIDYLSYHLPGFVFSVGMPPASAAAALAALRILRREPERVHRLQQNARFLFKLLSEAGYNLGSAQGHPIVPVILGDSQRTVEVAGRLRSEGVYTSPILFPAVPEESTRIRFFVCCDHTEQQLSSAVEALLKVSPPSSLSFSP